MLPSVIGGPTGCLAVRTMPESQMRPSWKETLGHRHLASGPVECEAQSSEADQHHCPRGWLGNGRHRRHSVGRKIDGAKQSISLAVDAVREEKSIWEPVVWPT